MKGSQMKMTKDVISNMRDKAIHGQQKDAVVIPQS